MTLRVNCLSESFLAGAQSLRKSKTVWGFHMSSYLWAGGMAWYTPRMLNFTSGLWPKEMCRCSAGLNPVVVQGVEQITIRLKWGTSCPMLDLAVWIECSTDNMPGEMTAHCNTCESVRHRKLNKLFSLLGTKFLIGELGTIIRYNSLWNAPSSKKRPSRDLLCPYQCLR